MSIEDFGDYWDIYLENSESEKLKESNETNVTYQELAEALETITNVLQLTNIQSELTVTTKLEELVDTLVGEAVISNSDKEYVLRKFKDIENQVENEAYEQLGDL